MEVTFTYERQRRQCGKGGCHCNTTNQAEWHGPYWYAFWTDPRTGKTRSRYVGKHFDPPKRRPGAYSERGEEPRASHGDTSSAGGSSAREQHRTPPPGASRRPPPPPPPPPGAGRRPPPPPPRMSRDEQDRQDAAFFGVRVDVSAGDLKRAWRTKLAENHPDQFPEGAQRMRQETIAKEINERYQRMVKYRGWDRRQARTVRPVGPS